MKESALARMPLLAVGLLTLAGGMWLGLIRLGWALPLPWPDQLIAHGPLMVCGFLGTLIGLERAVGLGKWWGYAAPTLTAAGAVWLGIGLVGLPGPLLFTLGSVVVLLIFLLLWWREPSLFGLTMTLASFSWVVGNLDWLAGAALVRVVFWWLTFLVLTVAGERLELNRVLAPTRRVSQAFACAVGLVLGGALLHTWWPEAGVRVLGAGLLALTWWLARNDIARRTVRQQGVTRFMAVCLLGGYAWLAVGGLIAAGTGTATSGLVYDAMLHAVFLGFVMSMVFAHAPVIFPAVLGVRLDYRRVFYVHLGLLHVSLMVRLVGDLVDVLGQWRAWGGLLNAMALLLFLFNTARSVSIPARAARVGAH